MRPGARRAQLRTLAAVAAVNIVIFFAIGLVLRSRPSTSLPAEPVAAQIAWDSRLAPTATDLDPTCNGCNLLLVSLDIFRPDHMPCFGYDKDTTPYICDLVKHGTVFDNFIVHAYQTPVSMMSMFTGRYPSTSGFTNFGSVLSPDIPYFPEILKQQGYSAVAMGSSFEVMSDMSAYAKGSLSFRKPGLNPGTSFGRGFDRFVFTGNRNVPSDAYAWLADQGKQPFFLWLILGTLHWPYGAHGDPAEQSRFDPPGYDGPLAHQRLGFEVVSHIFRGKLYGAPGTEPITLTPADTAYINARYDFGMWTVDQFVGELLASIPPDVLKHTVIALHGVHGEDLGEHRYFGHYDVYDTEVHNTLIVLSPNRRTEGVRIKAQVEGVDLAPTLLDLLGMPALPGAQGTSALATMKAGTGDEGKPAFFQRIPLWEDIFRYRTDMPKDYVDRIDPLLDHAVYGDTGMRTLRWKLLHRRSRALEKQVSWWTYLTGIPIDRPEWELYDLAADPKEQANLADQQPDVLPGLQAQLLAWEQKVGADVDPLRPPPDPAPTSSPASPASPSP